jgi:hypothetical protein
MTAYTVVSGNPTARLATGTSINVTINSSTPAEFSSGAVSQALTNGTVYCVAIGDDNNVSGSLSLKYDNGSAPGRFNSTNIGLANPFGYTGSDSGRHYSWWAVYTTSGGGATIYPVWRSVGSGIGTGIF